MEFISTRNALKPAGHYSQAIVHDRIVYLSGQLAVNPDTGEKEFGSIEHETLRVLKNIEIILEEAGSDMNHILKTTLYISDISQWNKVNKVYTEFLKEHKPARSIVPSRDLHFGFKIEIDVIAALV